MSNLWIASVKEWNAKKNNGNYMIPKANTKEYAAVRKILEKKKKRLAKEQKAAANENVVPQKEPVKVVKKRTKKRKEGEPLPKRPKFFAKGEDPVIPKKKPRKRVSKKKPAIPKEVEVKPEKTIKESVWTGEGEGELPSEAFEHFASNSSDSDTSGMSSDVGSDSEE